MRTHAVGYILHFLKALPIIAATPMPSSLAPGLLMKLSKWAFIRTLGVVSPCPGHDMRATTFVTFVYTFVKPFRKW